jgi:hypothetical protein
MRLKILTAISTKTAVSASQQIHVDCVHNNPSFYTLFYYANYCKHSRHNKKSVYCKRLHGNV